MGDMSRCRTTYSRAWLGGCNLLDALVKTEALFMLTLAKSAPGPSVSAWLLALSTIMYNRLQ